MNAGQAHALDLVVRRGRNVFVTGSGGTGKTYWIHAVCDALLKGKYGGNRERYGAAVILAAPTGVAANAISGVTIHSALGVGVPVKYLDFDRASYQQTRKRIAKWEVLVIDEISMLSAEFVEQMDRAMRNARRNQSQPFGGVQVVCVGDFHQLPPICRYGSKPEHEPPGKFLNYGFAFQSPAWRGAGFVNVVFHHPFRQSGDERFASMLNAVRSGAPDAAAQALADIAAECRNGVRGLLAREAAERKAEARKDGADDGIRPTRIFALNVDVDKINTAELRALLTPVSAFDAVDTVVGAVRRPEESSSAFQTRAKKYRDHEFFKHNISSKTVELAVGAQVMLTKTISVADGLSNGTRGVVVAMDPAPVVRFAHTTVVVEAREFVHDISDNGQVVALRRLQTPLKLAWALTVHKSQGMTLDRVVLSLKSMFASGHAYVALSRARSLDGLEMLDVPDCDDCDDPADAADCLLAWAKGLVRGSTAPIVTRFYRDLLAHAPGDRLPPPPAASGGGFAFDDEGQKGEVGGGGDGEWNAWVKKRSQSNVV